MLPTSLPPQSDPKFVVSGSIGGDRHSSTLDEPVSATLVIAYRSRLSEIKKLTPSGPQMRDLRLVGKKLKTVLRPKTSSDQALRELRDCTFLSKIFFFWDAFSMTGQTDIHVQGISGVHCWSACHCPCKWATEVNRERDAIVASSD